jgi:hypothetical protein
MIKKIKKLFGTSDIKPKRVATCELCGAAVRTEIMEGPVTHWFCLETQVMLNKIKRDKEAADRHQIDLYKTAIRELEEEKKNAVLIKEFDPRDLHDPR